MVRLSNKQSRTGFAVVFPDVPREIVVFVIFRSMRQEELLQTLDPPGASTEEASTHK